MLICDDCMEKLGRKSTKLARAWSELVSLSSFLDGDVILGLPLGNTEDLINQLDALGYIMSHETDDRMIIRIKAQGMVACINESH